MSTCISLYLMCSLPSITCKNMADAFEKSTTPTYDKMDTMDEKTATVSEKQSDNKSETRPGCSTRTTRDDTQTIASLKALKTSNSRPYTKPLRALLMGTLKNVGKLHVMLAEETGFIKLINTRRDKV